MSDGAMTPGELRTHAAHHLARSHELLAQADSSHAASKAGVVPPTLDATVRLATAHALLAHAMSVQALPSTTAPSR